MASKKRDDDWRYTSVIAITHGMTEVISCGAAHAAYCLIEDEENRQWVEDWLFDMWWGWEDSLSAKDQSALFRAMMKCAETSEFFWPGCMDSLRSLRAKWRRENAAHDKEDRAHGLRVRAPLKKSVKIRRRDMP